MPRLEGSLMLQIYTEILVLLCILTLPAIQQNYTFAYQQTVVANDRIHMLNYAKAVSCLRLITVVKVRRPPVVCKSDLLYIYLSVVHEYELVVDAHIITIIIIMNLNFYNVILYILIHLTRVQTAWKDSGEHAGIRNHPQKVIEMLTAAGWSFHRES